MTLSNAILATLAYHDIFDYPLTLPEIHRFLIGQKAKSPAVEQTTKQLLKAAKISHNRHFYFLSRRSTLVKLRLKRQKSSQKKLNRAILFASLLKIIPTVKLVAVSGALAMNNSPANDDIDLVLISAKDRLWTTRFLVNFLLWPFKRSPQSPKVANKACLNLFFDETSLKIGPANLYLAHEICQMRPLWDRDATYLKFLKANSWVKKYLPNWVPNAQRLTTNAKSQKSKKSNALVLRHLALVIENFLKNFQLWYMRPKITTERLGGGQLFFHPVNRQDWVLREFQKRLKKLGIV